MSFDSDLLESVLALGHAGEASGCICTVDTREVGRREDYAILGPVTNWRKDCPVHGAEVTRIAPMLSKPWGAE